MATAHRDRDRVTIRGRTRREWVSADADTAVALVEAI